MAKLVVMGAMLKCSFGMTPSSIQYEVDDVPVQNRTQETWVVCPRRLLGFKNIGTAIPETNRGLQPHEREVLSEIEVSCLVI